MQLNLVHMAFFAIFLSILARYRLPDSDYFWHLKTGQYLLENGSLPKGDIFSYTYADQPWVLHEWLFQLLLAGIHSTLGSFGIELMVAIVATATLLIIYATINRIINKPLVTLCFVILSYIFISFGVAPRPQLFTLILFATFLYVLIGFKYFRANRGLFILPPLMVLWVNFHGGFVVGLALLFLFTVCEWLKFLTVEYRDVEQRRRMEMLSLSVMITLLFSLINPYFINHWLYPFQVISMKTANVLIMEWHSPNFHIHWFKLYFILIYFFFIFTIYRQNKVDITELALPLFFITMGLISQRHIPLTAIVLFIFIAVAYIQKPFYQIVPEQLQKINLLWHNKLKKYDQDLGEKEYIINWLLLVLLICVFLILYPINKADNDKRTVPFLPIKATEFILKEDIKGRMFNYYDYGGYLIYQLYPAQKVFIDSRADLYGDDFLNEFIEISNGRENWAKLFDKHNIDYAVIPRDLALRQLLLARGDFKQVYEDDISSVLLKNNENNADIIVKYSQ